MTKADGRYERWKIETLARKRKTWEPVVCGYCAGSYLPTRSDQTNCLSAECRRAHSARMQRERGYTKESRGRHGRPDSTRRADARRRAVLWAADHESLSNTEVFERDGWLCGLCGCPVEADLAYPHPLSASLDHIVPLSRGGAHTLGNVQCSHLSCNLRKGVSVDARACA